MNLSDPSGEFVPLLIGGALYAWTAYDVYQAGSNCDLAGVGMALLPIGKIGKADDVAKFISKIPGNPWKGADAPSQAYNHLQKTYNIDPKVSGNRLHRIKQADGMSGTDNVVIGRTGDVYNEKTGEFIGSLTNSKWGN